MSTLASIGRGDIKEKNVADLLQGANAHEEELIVMAETSAYFHVAYKVCEAVSFHGL